MPGEVQEACAVNQGKRQHPLRGFRLADPGFEASDGDWSVPEFREFGTIFRTAANRCSLTTVIEVHVDVLLDDSLHTMLLDRRNPQFS